MAFIYVLHHIFLSR